MVLYYEDYHGDPLLFQNLVPLSTLTGLQK